MLTAGTLLHGRYEIHTMAGEGGMGAVYLAYDMNLARKRVAVKEMALSYRRSDDRERAVESFRREARLLATLDHPRLVPVSDFFESNGCAYLVMGFVDGQTLGSVAEGRDVTFAEALDWIDQIAQILEYLHEHDPPVLFRDLKPGNVMLDAQGQVRLIDFGIARTLEEGQDTNTFLRGAGTANFAPVEQFGGRGTDARSDIYSLGATMFNLLTGELPPVAVDVLTGESPPANPRGAHPALPPALEAVILKAMAVRKEDRYASVRDLRLDLVRISPAELQGLVRRPGAPVGPRPDSSERPGAGSSGGHAPHLKTERAATRLPNASGESPGTPLGGVQGGNRTANSVGVFLVLVIVVGFGALHLLTAASKATVAADPSPAASASTSSALASVPSGAPSLAPAFDEAGMSVLRIESRPPGARVMVDESVVMDGEEPAVTPLAIRIRPGRYRVDVAMSGFEPFTTYVKVREGRDRDLSARLVPVVSQMR